MKYSLSWINEFVDVAEFFKSPKTLADLLTSAGLEVEGIEDGSQQLAHVVVAELIEVGKHPNSDRLTLCQVNVGDKSLRQIICGAKNHKKGDKVLAALPGAVLPGDFKIKVSKIRDVESHGMLCSEKELGLSDDSEGIKILEASAKVGQAASEYLGKSDIFLEVNVTPNRADVLSHMGLAREIAILTGKPFKNRQPKFKKTSTTSVVKKIVLSHEDKENCSRFAGRLIQSVKVGPSPNILKSRLESLGVKSINNIVDATNYIMLEMGQPMHAYDLTYLKGNQIGAAKSKKGENFTSFDGSKFVLTGDELTIRNAEAVIGLAGVVGSTASGITNLTKDVYLESAHFLPASVRRTSRRFGIETDAAQRFSKGVDVDNVLLALDRCAELISEFAEGEVSADFHDSYPQPVKDKEVQVDIEKLKLRLGFAIEDKEVIALIQKTGSKVGGQGFKITVVPPKYRSDLNIAEDYLEEVARLKGYDHIADTSPPSLEWPSKHAVDYMSDRRWTQALGRAGFSQAVNYAFLDKDFNNRFALAKDKDGFGIQTELVEIANPLSDDVGVLRSNLIAGLLKNALANYRYGLDSGKLFEVGHVFSQEKSGELVETNRLGLVAWGEELNVFHRTKTPTVFAVKDAILAALKSVGVSSPVELKRQDFAMDSLHPGQRAKIYFQGKCVGIVGRLHPSIESEMKWRVEVAVAEINLEPFYAAAKNMKRVKELSKYPGAEKDFSFLIPKAVSASDLVKAMQKAGGESVESIAVIDSFADPAWDGKMESLTFRVMFRKKDGSFEDQELATIVQSVRDAVIKARPEVQLR